MTQINANLDLFNIVDTCLDLVGCNQSKELIKFIVKECLSSASDGSGISCTSFREQQRGIYAIINLKFDTGFLFEISCMTLDLFFGNGTKIMCSNMVKHNYVAGSKTRTNSSREERYTRFRINIFLQGSYDYFP